MNLISGILAERERSLAVDWRAAGLDWIERISLALLYGLLAVRVWKALDFASNGPANLTYLFSEGLVIFLLLTRRRADALSHRPADWLTALVATVAPLLIHFVKHRSVLPPSVTVSAVLAGLCIQILATMALGRSFGCVAANRGLKFSGPYRFVRHPIYVGYLLTHLGVLLANLTLWNVAIYAVCYAAQIPRLLAEERLLAHNAGYREYMNSVRYRLIPGVF